MTQRYWLGMGLEDVDIPVEMAGYEIRGLYMDSSHNRHLGVVICENEHVEKGGTQFVVWTVNVETDNPYVFHGTYTDDRAVAREEFSKRVLFLCNPMTYDPKFRNLDPELRAEDVILIDDGTLDTVFVVHRDGTGHEVRFSQDTALPYRNRKTGELDEEAFISDHLEEMQEATS